MLLQHRKHPNFAKYQSICLIISGNFAYYFFIMPKKMTKKDLKKIIQLYIRYQIIYITLFIKAKKRAKKGFNMVKNLRY